MRGVVLGACGAIGAEVAEGLAAAGVFDELVLADRDAGRLRALRVRIPGTATRRVDAADPAALRRAIRGAGILVNCTTYHLGVAALRAAIAERTDYLDLGGLYNTPKQLAMHERARRAGIRAILGCGATPGLTNVLARRAVERLDEVREIHIAFASHRDLAPSPGLLDTLLDEFRPGVRRFVWRGGRVREVAPFDGARRVRFPKPLGPQEVYFVPHSEVHTLPRSYPQLRQVDVRGTWRPQDMRALATLSRLGLTAERPVRVGEARVRPLDLLRAVLLADPPEEPSLPWAFFVEVEAVGTHEGHPRILRQQATHPAEWGRTATGRMTAVPAIVGASMLARGEVPGAGVLPPEQAFEPDAFLRGVRRLGIHIRSRYGEPD